MAFSDIEYIAELFGGGAQFEEQTEVLHWRNAHLRPAQDRERYQLDRHHRIAQVLAWREANRERWNLTQKARRQFNREHVNALARARYAERREELSEKRAPKLEAKRIRERERRQSPSYLANKAETEERNRAWRRANPEKVREARRRWERANPEKVGAMHRIGRARRRALASARLPPPVPGPAVEHREGR